MRHARGFTLLELMIALVVIAVLAAIAIPSYEDYVMRGKIAEAVSNLSTVRVAMEKYYADEHFYNASGTPGTCGVTLPSGANAKYFTIACTSGSASGPGDQTYTVTASGLANMSGFTYTLNESDARTTNITSPAGWATAGTVNCWIERKGDSC
jgi:prepilin-type N-terminal cleavage/methylation domain-containing protein